MIVSGCAPWPEREMTYCAFGWLWFVSSGAAAAPGGIDDDGAEDEEEELLLLLVKGECGASVIEGGSVDGSVL